MQLKQLREESLKKNSGLNFYLSSAVQVHKKSISYIHINLFILLGYILNSQFDQLQVGLIAQIRGGFRKEGGGGGGEGAAAPPFSLSEIKFFWSKYTIILSFCKHAVCWSLCFFFS